MNHSSRAWYAAAVQSRRGAEGSLRYREVVDTIRTMLEGTDVDAIKAAVDNVKLGNITAMLKNFYQYLLAKVSEIFPGVDMKSRLKRFVFAFIVVPAKWVRVARQWTLNIYTKDRWLHYRTIFKVSYG